MAVTQERLFTYENHLRGRIFAIDCPAGGATTSCGGASRGRRILGGGFGGSQYRSKPDIDLTPAGGGSSGTAGAVNVSPGA